MESQSPITCLTFTNSLPETYEDKRHIFVNQDVLDTKSEETNTDCLTDFAIWITAMVFTLISSTNILQLLVFTIYNGLWTS